MQNKKLKQHKWNKAFYDAKKIQSLLELEYTKLILIAQKKNSLATYFMEANKVTDLQCFGPSAALIIKVYIMKYPIMETKRQIKIIMVNLWLQKDLYFKEKTEKKSMIKRTQRSRLYENFY